ncbi:MAG: PRC-barrel domain-containing protein, partial [Actinomycetota bacterium]
MIRSARSLGGYRVQAEDGAIGRVHDILFDDKKWIVRYLTIRTGGWLAKREKLVSPIAVDRPDWSRQTLYVDLTVDQVKNSPDIEKDKPVSLQRQIELHHYFGWPPYWEEEAAALENEDSHLRSVLEVLNYRVQATDEEVGYVSDLLLDDGSWEIRYMAIKARMWLPAKKVLVSPLWMQWVSWKEKKIYLDMPKEVVRNSP